MKIEGPRRALFTPLRIAEFSSLLALDASQIEEGRGELTFAGPLLWISSAATTFLPPIYGPSPMAPSMFVFENKGNYTRGKYYAQTAWRIDDENERRNVNASTVLRVLGCCSSNEHAVAGNNAVTNNTVEYSDFNNYDSNRRPGHSAGMSGWIPDGRSVLFA
jgi:hypothetical protein